MASLAAGIEPLVSGGTFLGPVKLVRQRNRLCWYNELQIHGYSVVSSSVVKAYDSNVVVNGKEIICPENHIILTLS